MLHEDVQGGNQLLCQARSLGLDLQRHRSTNKPSSCSILAREFKNMAIQWSKPTWLVRSCSWSWVSLYFLSFSASSLLTLDLKRAEFVTIKRGRENWRWRITRNKPRIQKCSWSIFSYKAWLPQQSNVCLNLFCLGALLLNVLIHFFFQRLSIQAHQLASWL